MITAVVMITADAAQIPEAAQAIANLPGVSEVYSVTGEVDLIAVVKVRQHEDLAGVIADKMSKTPGVVSTQTFIAFQTFSAQDLDSAYSLGLDD
ncbi:MAG: Lrp/AsnC ligand binding domain-containing protein [Bifidobacteriaceae bacterium]|jgi:DNA-binding Lrp family transcriptional regulator|nr:Lrp/AsnC ligand binding domain-containing protein [Bifidobacteriaceae bacterium]